MRSYIIRRILLMIPTVLFVTIIIFTTIRLVPGSIIDIMVADYSAYGGTISTVGKQAIEHDLGMDVPIYVQYGRWLDQIVHGNLGTALWQQAPVVDSIEARWPVTFELGLLALIIAQLIAVPIGVYSALRQNTWGDFVSRSFAILCIAVPSFWLATLVIVYPSIWWGYMPPLTLIRFTADPLGNLKMFIVPAIILGMGMSGGTMRMSRTMMLEVMRQDYVRTAWAKGLKERVVVTRHALKNALIPIVTIIGQQMGVLVGGTVIIESIFNLPGMGLLTISAIQDRDYITVEACLLLYAVVLVVINFITDLTYGYLDPRIHYT
jgi:peptide/nickel transport system permease protein